MYKRQDLVFWSGNDSDTVPMMALGAVGVISVASNIIPKDVAKLCELGQMCIRDRCRRGLSHPQLRWDRWDQ